MENARLGGRLNDEQVASAHEQAQRLFASMIIVDVTGGVLRRAEKPFRTALGTLDALHLASALMAGEKSWHGDPGNS